MLIPAGMRLGARILALVSHMMPKFGPLKGLGFKVPTPEKNTNSTDRNARRFVALQFLAPVLA
jgi:hypothetical protein